jgi:hypothetical protein
MPRTGSPSASRIRQPPSEITGTSPRRFASATSLSVPHDPPTTITASALATMIALRASPMPVAIVTVEVGRRALPASASGGPRPRRPPRARAPAATAAITPGAAAADHHRAPRAARSSPTSRADAASASVQSAGPQTATCSAPGPRHAALISPGPARDQRVGTRCVVGSQDSPSSRRKISSAARWPIVNGSCATTVTAGLQQIGEREVVEADERDPLVQPEVAQRPDTRRS